jgi:hypothetical protein
MYVLMVTSCTGEKRVQHPKHLTRSDFELGAAHLTKREQELAPQLTPAEDLYTGQQHVRLMRGVRAFRAAKPHMTTRNASIFDLWIPSAGYEPCESHSRAQCTLREISRWGSGSSATSLNAE